MKCDFGPGSDDDGVNGLKEDTIHTYVGAYSTNTDTCVIVLVLALALTHVHRTHCVPHHRRTARSDIYSERAHDVDSTMHARTLV